jgi:superfamily I DNA/RNA helicase
MTYKTCKGLEFDDVFILEADSYEKSFIDAGTRRQYYVACTRARENLSFIYRDPESSVIRQLLAPENIRLFRKISWEPQEILVKYMKVFRE